jgi:hypothetical protein
MRWVRRLRSRLGGSNINNASGEEQAVETLPWLRDLSQDIRYGSRQLHTNPAFAVTAILVLAIGIGANTALD